MGSDTPSEERVPHELLPHMLTRPGLYVGAPGNIAESLWGFMSGYDAGVRCQRTDNEEPVELIPRALLRHIQAELGLQFNDMGIIPRLVEQEGSPESALAALRQIIGDYYNCTIDRDSVPPLNDRD